MTLSFVILLLVLSISSRAVDTLFFQKVKLEVEKLKRENVDTVIIYGMNNFNSTKMPVAFTVIYSKRGIYYRKIIQLERNVVHKKMGYSRLDSLGYYSIVFDYLRENYQAITRQVDTVTAISAQHRIVNGQVVKISSNGYMGVGFYLGIFVGDQEYSDNLSVGRKMAYMNRLFRTAPEYWTFFSFLSNIGITQRREVDFW
jgi:hypothetical protein